MRCSGWVPDHGATSSRQPSSPGFEGADVTQSAEETLDAHSNAHAGRYAWRRASRHFLTLVGLEPAMVRYVLIVFGISRVMFALVTILALRFLHMIPYHRPVPTFLGAWARWDATHYAWIALHGYVRGPDEVQAAFFPLQPLLVRIVMPVVGGNADVAGMVVSNACAIVASLGLAALAAHDFDTATARRVVLYLTFFPVGLFFFAGYAESLFLALAAWCLFALRRRWWWQAAVLGMLATLTRQMGLFLALPFAYTYMAHLGWRVRAVRPNMLLVLLIPGGLLLFMGWLWHSVGDPLAFAHVESHWKHVSMPFWETLRRAVINLLHNPDPIDIRKGLIDLAAIALVACLIVRGAFMRGEHRLPPGDLLYCGAVWLLAVSYPTTLWWLQSDARYMMAAFPCFMLLAWEGRRPWLNVLVLAAFVGALLMMTQYFVRGAVIV